jgi:HAD superfamily hydrolase (TIGR01484 family)
MANLTNFMVIFICLFIPPCKRDVLLYDSHRPSQGKKPHAGGHEITFLMRPLSAPGNPALLLSFDFDGTLHHPADEPSVPELVFGKIRELRSERGAVWGINTGRSLPQMIEGFIESRFPFLPDWVVAREREIYYPNDCGRWIPHAKWNARCEKEMHKLFKRARKFLKSVRHDIEEHTGAQWLEMDGEPAGIISRTEEEMEWIAARIAARCDEPSLGWQRNSIYLRFGHADFQKGSSLAEIARQHDLTASACFAVGDSHNDLEMLDPRHASMLACPSNAVAAVKEKITGHGGYIAGQSHGLGAHEALVHHLP